MILLLRISLRSILRNQSVNLTVFPRYRAGGGFLLSELAGGDSPRSRVIRRRVSIASRSACSFVPGFGAHATGVAGCRPAWLVLAMSAGQVPPWPGMVLAHPRSPAPARPLAARATGLGWYRQLARGQGVRWTWTRARGAAGALDVGSGTVAVGPTVLVRGSWGCACGSAYIQ